MKAPDIRYHRPLTLDDALECLADREFEYQPLAGGQSLMPMMHLRLAHPEVLLDLNKLEELAFIKEGDTHLHIGAMVRYSSLMASQTVRKNIPLFGLALPHIAHEAIRNRGTIGGSVALADPAAEMPALLRTLDATVVAASKGGEREISADEFFLGTYDTALDDGELVHSVKIPLASAEHRYGFYELARRHGDYAVAGVAISAHSVQPFSGLRIVFFSVGDRALRAEEAEAALEGAMDNDTQALEAAQQALASLDFFADANASVKTKAHLARVVLKRALLTMQKENA